MQRPSSSSRVSRDYHTIDMSYSLLLQQQQEEEEDKTSTSSGNFRSKSVPTKPQKCLHLIPMIVLLCFFVLWYFSYPVNLEIRDGRLTEIRQIQMLHSVNDTQVDLTILVDASFPEVTVPETQIGNTTNAPQPASGRD